ncbi:MAG: triose-phosphate isomerase family protein [Candidatus Magasanikbacteria bacterium]
MKYIFGNWKLYLNNEESLYLAEQLVTIPVEKNELEVCVFPNALSFQAVKNVLVSSEYAIGAQNVNWTPRGAYTGALSAVLFKEVGATFALVGHSERRYVFGDTNEDIRHRFEACVDARIAPVLCIGETEDDKENGKTEYRIKKQLMKVFENMDLDDTQFFIAYEPVWAISQGGSGKACAPEDAAQVFSLIKEELKQYTANDVPLIYGGSVNAKNVESYISLEGVSGVLPGHASTKIEDLKQIMEVVLQIKK